MSTWYIGNDESPSLSHHGILGMKWGVRRYQNPDGSLTDAGKKRYSGNTYIESRANDAIKSAGMAHKLAKKYTDAMDRKASKKGTKESLEEAQAAHKLAKKYTDARDRKAAEKSKDADKYLEKKAARDAIKAKKQAERDEKNRIKAENKAIRAERKKQLRLRRTLSDKDLLEGIGRLEKEKKYKELLKEDLERGNKDVNDVLKQSGKKVATMALTGTALYVGQAWLKKNFDPKVAADYIFQKPSFKK